MAKTNKITRSFQRNFTEKTKKAQKNRTVVKWVFFAFLALVGLKLITTLFKAISKGFEGLLDYGADDETKQEKEESLEAAIADVEADVNDTELTISANRAEAIANAQEKACASPSGTNTDLLFSELDGLNKDDLMLVYSKFGIRNYGLDGDPNSYMSRFLGSDNKLDLIGWYKEELSNLQFWKKGLSDMKEIWKETKLFN